MLTFWDIGISGGQSRSAGWPGDYISLGDEDVGLWYIKSAMEVLGMPVDSSTRFLYLIRKYLREIFFFFFSSITRGWF